MPSDSPKFAQPAESDFPYFRPLWNSIVTALFAAAFIPMLLIGGGMYYYAASALEEKTLDLLRSEVRQHQETVDQFLTERITDLQQIAGFMDLGVPTQTHGFEQMLKRLKTGPWFTDLGVIDGQGRHLAYAGPYDLISRNYKDAEWFKEIMVRDVYISNVFSGFRKVPHFIIAVRKDAGGKTFILRATVNAGFFDKRVMAYTEKSGGDSFLVAANGTFQTRPRSGGKLMGASRIDHPEHFDGIKVEEQQRHIRVMGWLKSVPWLSVVQVEKKVIFGPLKRIRNVGAFVLILGSILIGFTVLLTTNHLVSRLETKRKNIRLMDHHLRQANKMTTSLQLYTGFFQEMNETMANIDSAAAWIGEQSRDVSDPGKSREEINGSLQQIRDEILRSRKTIQQVIRFSQPVDPMVADININTMLEELIELFQRELYFNNINIVRSYHKVLPLVRSDPSQIRQVFQNLMFNAITAIDKGGEISLVTQRLDERIRVTITDTGPGIPEDMVESIFDPLFTTHPKRLGLGLSICRSILEKLGGAISVVSTPGSGTAFAVDLPFRLKENGNSI